MIRVRKSLHVLIKSLGSHYDSKNVKKILEEITSVRKKLAQVEDMSAKEDIDNEKSQKLLTGVFNDDIHRTLRTNFGPRKMEPITFKKVQLFLNQALETIEGTFRQLELFVPAPVKVSEWRSRL